MNTEPALVPAEHTPPPDRPDPVQGSPATTELEVTELDATEPEAAGEAAGAEAAAGEPAAAADPAPVLPTLSPAACGARLAELYPAVFTPGAAKPLKLRIQADIQQRSPGTFTRKALSLFLQRHTTSTAYLRALARQPQRIDLDGTPAGEVSEEHRSAAAAEVQRRQALHEERRQAERQAQRAAERQAHEEARRQHAEQDEARRHRAGLLRAWETTTLTRANFCALKMLPEAGLDALLAQARQEREQAPRPTPSTSPERLAPRPGERKSARPTDRGPGRPGAPPASARPGERGPRPAPAGGPRRGSGAGGGGRHRGGAGGAGGAGGPGGGDPT